MQRSTEICLLISGLDDKITLATLCHQGKNIAKIVEVVCQNENENGLQFPAYLWNNSCPRIQEHSDNCSHLSHQYRFLRVHTGLESIH